MDLDGGAHKVRSVTYRLKSEPSGAAGIALSRVLARVADHGNSRDATVAPGQVEVNDVSSADLKNGFDNVLAEPAATFECVLAEPSQAPVPSHADAILT